jgi:hypothetical protein
MINSKCLYTLYELNAEYYYKIKRIIFKLVNTSRNCITNNLRLIEMGNLNCNGCACTDREQIG